MSVTRVALAWFAAAAAVLAACESATNLDVTYAPNDAGAGDAATADGSSEGAAPVVLEGCPCDPTKGEGCCVTAKDAFCTDNATICANEKGALLDCSRRDPLTESECCWHGSGVGAITALAVACDGGPSACLDDTDCTAGVKCEKSTCAGFTFGACGSKPLCP